MDANPTDSDIVDTIQIHILGLSGGPSVFPIMNLKNESVHIQIIYNPVIKHGNGESDCSIKNSLNL
jgi:hypothetical protein